LTFFDKFADALAFSLARYRVHTRRPSGGVNPDQVPLPVAPDLVIEVISKNDRTT
jgi:hypothetical protein